MRTINEVYYEKIKNELNKLRVNSRKYEARNKAIDEAVTAVYRVLILQDNKN